MKLVLASGGCVKNILLCWSLVQYLRPASDCATILIMNQCLPCVVIADANISISFAAFPPFGYFLPSAGVFLLHRSLYVSLSGSLCVCVCVLLPGHWSVCLAVCLSPCLPLGLPLCLSFCLCICSSMCLSICLSVCPSVYPSVRPFVRPSVCCIPFPLSLPPVPPFVLCPSHPVSFSLPSNPVPVLELSIPSQSLSTTLPLLLSLYAIFLSSFTYCLTSLPKNDFSSFFCSWVLSAPGSVLG